MTHTIKHQYDELLPASLPGLEIHVVYHCESEITFDEYGDEESNRLIEMFFRIDGHNPPMYKIPKETDGKEWREFLALLRESARQALWAKALRVAVAFPVHEQMMAAERWQRTGDLEQSLSAFPAPTTTKTARNSKGLARNCGTTPGGLVNVCESALKRE